MAKRDWFVVIFFMITMPTLFIIGAVFEQPFICMAIFFLAFFGIVIHRIREESKMPKTENASQRSISNEQMYGTNTLDPFNYVKTDHSDPFDNFTSNHEHRF